MQKKLTKTSMVIAAVSGLLVSSQGPAVAQSKTTDGAILGGIFGGIVGAVVPGASNATRILAPVVGSLIGASIGAQLDAADRAAMENNTRRAISSGSGRNFSSRGGRGRVVVTNTGNNSSGQPCRTARQEFTKADGTVVSDQVSACKGPNGWNV